MVFGKCLECSFGLTPLSPRAELRLKHCAKCCHKGTQKFCWSLHWRLSHIEITGKLSKVAGAWALQIKQRRASIHSLTTILQRQRKGTHRLLPVWKMLTNHKLVVMLESCMPSAADEGWHSPKRPYSTVAVNSLWVCTEVSFPFFCSTKTGLGVIHVTVVCMWGLCMSVQVIRELRRYQVVVSWRQET